MEMEISISIVREPCSNSQMSVLGMVRCLKIWTTSSKDALYLGEFGRGVAETPQSLLSLIGSGTIGCTEIFMPAM
ncbi:hypothetical protein ACOSQ4_028933 [Xanthoceras sorbifolium]